MNRKKLLQLDLLQFLCRAVIDAGVSENLAFDFSDQEMRNIFKINDFDDFDEL